MHEGESVSITVGVTVGMAVSVTVRVSVRVPVEDRRLAVLGNIVGSGLEERLEDGVRLLVVVVHDVDK